MSSDTAWVQHDSPLGTLAVPTLDGGVHVVERGVPTEVPASVAGRDPGPWEALAEGGVPDLDDGRSWRCVDGVWEVRDPGAGLLAQDDLWAAVKAPVKAKSTGPAAAADTTPEG